MVGTIAGDYNLLIPSSEENVHVVCRLIRHVIPVISGIILLVFIEWVLLTDPRYWDKPADVALQVLLQIFFVPVFILAPYFEMKEWWPVFREKKRNN